MPSEIEIVHDRNQGYGVAYRTMISACPNGVDGGLEVICWCHKPQDAQQIKTLLSEQVALGSTGEQPIF